MWKLVGIALVIWVAYDLWAGYTYSYRLVLADSEPLHYWLTLVLWAIIAGVTLYWG